LNSKINEFYLELGVLTKNVIVMLLIVLAEAALRICVGHHYSQTNTNNVNKTYNVSSPTKNW
jgi:hypothetical protein